MFKAKINIWIVFLIICAGFCMAPYRGRYNPILWLRSMRDIDITEPEADHDHLEYDLATDKWVNVANLTMGGYIDMNTFGIEWDLPNSPDGLLTYNRTDATLDLGKPGGNVSQQLGEEFLKRVLNNSGSTIPDGTPVYISGEQGNKLTIAPADASYVVGIAFRTYGITTEEISNGVLGYITKAGLVRGIDTTLAPTAGVPFYLAVGGGYALAPPTSPDVTVLLGIVEKRSEDEGELDVHIRTLPNYNSLSDVLISSLSNNDIMQWDATDNRWENKSDIVIDSVSLDTLKFLAADETELVNLTTATQTTPDITTLNLQGQISGDQFVTQFRTADADGTDRVQLILTGKGGFSTGGPSDVHYLQMRWDPGDDAYQIFPTFAAPETFKPLQIGVHTDNDMLVIRETDINFTVPIVGVRADIDAIRIDGNSISNIAGNPINLRPNNEAGNRFIFESDGTIDTLTALGDFTLTVTGGDLNITSDQFNVSSTTDSVGIGIAAQANSKLDILMSATDTMGIHVDGLTNPYDYADGAVQTGFSRFTREIDGTGIIANNSMARFDNTLSASISGTGTQWNNKDFDGITSFYTISGNLSAGSGGFVGATKQSFLNNARFETLLTGDITTTGAGATFWQPQFVSFKASTQFSPGTITSSNGNVLYQSIGGIFESMIQSGITHTHTLGTQTLEAIGGDFRAIGQTGIADLPTTSIAGKFSATDSDTNIAIQVDAGTTNTLGRIRTTTRITGNTILDETNHEVFCDTDGGAFTVTLPAGVDGTNYRITNTGSSGNAVTLTPDGSELLIGENSNFTLLDGDVLIITNETTEGWW